MVIQRLRQQNKFNLNYKRSKYGLITVQRAWELYFANEGWTLARLHVMRSIFKKRKEWADVFPPNVRSGIHLGLFLDDEAIREAEKAECVRLYTEITDAGYRDSNIKDFFATLGHKRNGWIVSQLYRFDFADVNRGKV